MSCRHDTFQFCVFKDGQKVTQKLLIIIISHTLFRHPLPPTPRNCPLNYLKFSEITSPDVGTYTMHTICSASNLLALLLANLNHSPSRRKALWQDLQHRPWHT